jgi:hypothetical protein
MEQPAADHGAYDTQRYIKENSPRRIGGEWQSKLD